MNILKQFKKLCMPAVLYLILSLLALLIIIMQNFNNSHTLCVANYSCPMSNIPLFFIFNILYILFWTWILHLICKSGWNIISWMLVLFPFILAFIIVILGMSQN